MNDIVKNLLIILLTSILTENFILSKFLGICPFLGVSNKISGALGMGVAVIFVMTMSSIITFPIYHYILIPLEIEFMNTIVFIVLIATFVQLVEIVMKKFMPPLHKMLGVYLPLITTNCAVLAVTLLNITNEYTFLEATVNAFAAGVGFLLVMLLFSGVRERIARSNVPEVLQGTPITLIAASIVSLSFIGFGGMVQGIFE